MNFPGGSDSKESACNEGDLGSTPGLERSLEEGMTTHSSILALRILTPEEPDRLQSMGLQRVRQNWTTKHNTAQMEAYNVHYKNQERDYFDQFASVKRFACLIN